MAGQRISTSKLIVYNGEPLKGIDRFNESCNGAQISAAYATHVGNLHPAERCLETGDVADGLRFLL
jgi:hypothetical protein